MSKLKRKWWETLIVFIVSAAAVVACFLGLVKLYKTNDPTVEAEGTGKNEAEGEEQEHLHEYLLIEIVEPTCTSDGKNTFECTECGEKETQTLAMFAHEYALIESIEPTCTSDGKNTFECDVCGEKETQTLAMLAHEYALIESIGATCTTAGKNTFECTKCGERNTNYIPMKHAFRITSRTWDDDGGETDTYACDFCGKEPSESLKMIYDTCFHVDNNNDNMCDICGLLNDRIKKPTEDDLAE